MLRIAVALLVPLALGFGAGMVRAEPSTPPSPTSPQPTLPSSAAPKKPGSPVVEQIMERDKPPLVVRKRTARVAEPVRRHRRVARRGGRVLDRPALAGVELVAPLPPPGEPPHVTVPVPAYPLESIAAAITTPPPPIVCHPTRRDPTAPDPHLHQERPVICEPDNP